MITRSPISACVIVAPAPIAQSRPMRTCGPITAVGADHRAGADFRARADHGRRIDGHAGFEPRRRMHQRARRHAARLEQRGRAQRGRERASARPPRTPDRARASPARRHAAARRPRSASVTRQMPARVVANCAAYFTFCMNERSPGPARSSGAMPPMRRSAATPGLHDRAGERRDLLRGQAVRALEEQRLGHCHAARLAVSYRWRADDVRTWCRR